MSMKEPSVASDSRLGTSRPAPSSTAVGERTSEWIEAAHKNESLFQPRQADRTIALLVCGGNMRRTLAGNAEQKIYDRFTRCLRSINRSRSDANFCPRVCPSGDAASTAPIVGGAAPCSVIARPRDDTLCRARRDQCERGLASGDKFCIVACVVPIESAASTLVGYSLMGAIHARRALHVCYPVRLGDSRPRGRR